MRATKRLRLFDQFRVATIRTLIGLLASAGLRIGEALRLRLEDLRLTASPPYLVIRDTKFGKSRNVVLHPTARNHLRKYFGERAKVLGAKRVDVFLTNRMAKRLNYSSQRAMFGRLLRRAGIRSTPGQRRPSIHSFRHTFAVRRLTQWHHDRKNVQELLPHLSVYLGHIGPASTYWYLTATPELLQTAARSFERQQSQGAGSKCRQRLLHRQSRGAKTAQPANDRELPGYLSPAAPIHPSQGWHRIRVTFDSRPGCRQN